MNYDNGRINYEVGLDNSLLRSQANETTAILKGISTSAAKEGANIDSVFSNLGKTIAGAFSVTAAVEFARKVVDVRAEIESLEISFKTLLGNEAKANAMFSEIRRFAVQTPMQLKDLASAAQMMLSFNIEDTKIMPYLKALGDISMGDAQKFQSLSLAFSQMSSTGKLMGQDLLQMINAGFNPLVQIAEKTGKSIKELKDEMSAGKISAQMVQQAFLDAAGAGGKYHGMLESQSKGIKGSLSNLQGAIDDMLNDIGSSTQRVITGAVGAATILVKNYQEVADAIMAIVATYGVYKAALLANDAVEKNIGKQVLINYEAEKAAINALIAGKEAESAANIQVETSDIKVAVSKGYITEAQGKEIAATRMALAEHRKALMVALQEAAAAEKAAKDKLKLALQDSVAAKQQLAIEQERLLAMNAYELHINGAAQKEAIHTAAVNANSAAISVNNARKELSIATSNKKAAAQALETVGTQADTVAKGANIAATNLLSVAIGKLKNAFTKLTATMSANKYAIIAAAIVALGYAIYKLITHQTEAQKAQDKLNKSIGESESKWLSEKAAIDSMFNALRNAERGSKSYHAVKNTIIQQYGQYLQGLIDEKNNLLDLETAYKRVSAAAEAAARARMYDNAVKTAQDNYDATAGGETQKILDILKKRSPNDASALMALIRSQISENGFLDDETKYQIYTSFGVEKDKRTSTGFKRDNDIVKLLASVDKIREAGYILQENISNANDMFNTISNDFIGKQIDALKQAKEELQDAIDSNSQNFADGFEIIVNGKIVKTVKTSAEARHALTQMEEALKKANDNKPKNYQTELAAAIKREKEAEATYKRLKNDATATLAEVQNAEAAWKASKKTLKDEFDYDVDRNAKTSAKATKEADKTASEIAERKQKLAEYRDSIILAARDAQFEIREAEISAMDEGFDKEIATAQLNYDRLIAANKDRQQKLVEELADAKTLEWLNANPHATKEQQLDYRNSLVDPYAFLDKGTAGIAMSNIVNGNVDMLARPLVEAAKLVEQGWTEAGEGIAALFSSDYGIIDGEGKERRILVTPILPDGSVMTPKELDAYVSKIINGSADILSADKKGIVIGIDLPDDAGEVLHQLQEIYYMGSHESTEGVLGLNDLATSEQKMLEEYQRIADEGFAKANKTALENMLADILSYEQQREKIQSDFARRRKMLYQDGDESKGLHPGVTSENLSELNKQEEEALKAVDEQFAQRSETYKAWCEEIADWSIQALEDELEKAKKVLEELEKSITKADKQKLAIARAKVETTSKELKEKEAQQNTSPDKRSIKEWQDLYKTLQDCEKEFEAIGDTVEGAAGEIITTAGQIATSTLSMINGIVTLANWSIMATKMTAEGASKAIQSVERASVILTIISAAMQVAMTIIDLFNSDKQKQKEIERLQDMIDKLQWEREHAEIMRYTTLEKSLDLVIEKLNETRLQLFYAKYASGDTFGALVALCGSARANTELLNKSAEKLADTYAQMKYTADKALGEERYKEARSQLENIAKQQILLSEQIENEQGKKKSDSGAIEEYKQKIAELGQEATALINDLVEDIMGNSAADMAKELGDAFIEAFQAGEDAAVKWGEKVDDIVADILKRLLVQKFLEEPLGEIFNKYKKIWFGDNGGFEGGLQGVINSIPELAQDLQNTINLFQTGWSELPDEIKSLFATEAQREGAQQGIATASQESVDELNAQMTTVQGHTYSISENTKILVSTAGRILESVVNIDRNTDGLSDRVAVVETVVKDMRNTLNDISLKGIKIK